MKVFMAVKRVYLVVIILLIWCLFGITNEEANASTTNLTQKEGVMVTASVNDATAMGLIDGTNDKAVGSYQDDEGNTVQYAWSFWSAKAASAVVDLGAYCSLSEIKLYMGYPNGGSKRPEKFALYYSRDNVNYTQFDQQEDTVEKYTKMLDNAIVARYIKLEIPEVENAREVRIRELEIYGVGISDAATNITKYANLSVESSQANDASVAGLVDGDKEQGGSYPDNGGAWVYYSSQARTAIIDLGANYHIAQIKLYLGYKNNQDSNTNNRPEVFYLSGSTDLKNYSEIYRVTAEPAEEYVIDYDKIVHSIKLEIPGAADGVTKRTVRIREIEIYGYPASDDEIGGKGEIVYPNAPMYLQNKREAKLDITIDNLSNTTEVYVLEYSPKGDFTDTVVESGTIPALEILSRKIDLSSLAKGKYPNFEARLYLNNRLIMRSARPLTITEFAEQQPLSEYSRIGVNWHIDMNTTAYQNGREVENYQKLMRNLGISNTRSLHRWGWLETTKGIRNFDKHNYTDGLMVQYGQKFSPYILGFGNKLYFDEEPRSYQNVMDTIDYNTDVVDNLMSKGVEVKSLEIWNEPNLKSFWGSDRWITYSQLANRMAFAMKKKYPEKQILAGAISSTGDYGLQGDTYIDAFFRRGGLMYVDEFSCHPYTFTSTPDERHYDRAGYFINRRDEAGGWVNVSVTEVGYSTFEDGWGVSDVVQSEYLPKYFVYNDELDVALTDLYTFEDTGSDPKEREHNFGIVDRDFVPKEGYVSMAQLIKYCANAEYIGRFPVNDDAYMYVYTSPRGVFSITWIHNASPAFSYPLEEDVEAEDLYGNPIESGNGTISIGSNPVYLTHLPVTYLARATASQAELGLDEIIAAFGAMAPVDTAALQSIKAAFDQSKVSSPVSLKSAVDGIYGYGLDLIEAYQTNPGEMELKELAVVLSKLHRIAKRAAAAYSYFDVGCESSNTEYQRVVETIAIKKGSEPDSSLLYTDAIMRFAGRYNNKANEISVRYDQNEENFIGRIGAKTAADMMAKQLSLWAEEFSQLETPDLSRAIFTYLSDTNPTIYRGDAAQITIEVENLLDQHTVNGELVWKDETGNPLGAAISCSVSPGMCKSFELNGVIPETEGLGQTILYVDLVENGVVLKRSEVEATIEEAFPDAPIKFSELGLYREDNTAASAADIVPGNSLTVKANITKHDEISDGLSLIVAQYQQGMLTKVELVSIPEAFAATTATEQELSKTITVHEMTERISLFVMDINSLECMYFCREVEKK